MNNDAEDFYFEYHFVPSPVAEELLAQGWDIIVALMLEDIKAETTIPESESC